MSNTEKFSNQLDYILRKLSDESTSSIQFIRDFIERTKSLELFIKYITKSWPGIWKYLINDLSFSDKEVYNIFKLIIEYADISSIEKIRKILTYLNTFQKNQIFLE